MVNGLADLRLEWTHELRDWLLDRVSQRVRAKAEGCAAAFARALPAEAAKARIDRTFGRYAQAGICMGGISIDRAFLRSRKGAPLDTSGLVERAPGGSPFSG